MNHIRIEAHRGVGTDAPENTFPAFEAAVEQGYDMIELDLKFPCGATSWVSEKIRRASKEFVDELHGYGVEVGIWLLRRDEELATAIEYGADILETDGAIKPR